MRSQEPRGSPGEDPHPGMRGSSRWALLGWGWLCCDAAALFSLGVSTSPFVSLLELLWNPRTGGSSLHDLYSQREGNGGRCKPSLCESQPGQHSHLASRNPAVFQAWLRDTPCSLSRGKRSSQELWSLSRTSCCSSGLRLPQGTIGLENSSCQDKSTWNCWSGEGSVLWLSWGRDVFGFISCCLEEESGEFSHLRSVFYLNPGLSYLCCGF